MTDTRPSPMTAPQCDLTDFQFMPLDVMRLRDSELASSETPEACWAAVLLWAASWHQVPAASVPNDDKWLAKAAGYGRVVKEWLRVRAGALRGFVECSDGRLYHAVVAEKAREAWKAKLEQRWRTECARIKKSNERHGTNLPRPSFDDWLSSMCPQGQTPHVPGETPSKGQGEGQGQGQGDSSSEAIASGADAPTEAGLGGGDADPPLPPPCDPPPPPPSLPTLPPEPPPPPTPHDPADVIFGLGVPLLTAAGVAERNVRSMLGLMRKTNGDAAVIGALQRCATEKPLQPVAWLQAALKKSAAPSRHTGFDTKDYRAGVTEDGHIA